MRPSVATLAGLLIGTTLAWPLIFLAFAAYAHQVNPAAFSMGMGFVYLAALLIQALLSALSATVCKKPFLPILALIAFLGIALFL